MSFLHPFQGPLRLAPQSFTYNLKLRDWRRIGAEDFDAFIYFTWFLDFSLFPSFYKFPNIYGAVNAYHAPFYAAVGAMSLGGNVTGHAPSGVSSGGTGSENVVISGTNSSSIYKGEFNTVQPPALRALALIRAY